MAYRRLVVMHEPSRRKPHARCQIIYQQTDENQNDIPEYKTKDPTFSITAESTVDNDEIVYIEYSYEYQGLDVKTGIKVERRSIRPRYGPHQIGQNKYDDYKYEMGKECSQTATAVVLSVWKFHTQKYKSIRQSAIIYRPIAFFSPQDIEIAL